MLVVVSVNTMRSEQEKHEPKRKKKLHHLCLRKKGITFFLVNQSFFSMDVFLEQCSAVLDDDTGGTGFLIKRG